MSLSGVRALEKYYNPVLCLSEVYENYNETANQYNQTMYAI